MKILALMKPTNWGNIVRKFIEENFTDYLIVTGDWGDTEIDFFNKKKEAQKFVKEEFGKCKKI